MSFICLIDCDNFFASCEKLFHPEYRNKPLVVVSGKNGIIIARSAEAKKLRIPMGGASFEYKSLFAKESVIVKGTNFALYTDISKRIQETVETFSFETFKYSVDEMFLQIPENLATDELLKQIQDKIKQWVGIDVSIGLSRTKTLAKIATKIAKKLPSHRNILTSKDEITSVLKTFPVEDLWGIGRKLSKKLHLHQVKTAYDLATLGNEFLRKLLGVNGARLDKELRGTNAHPFYQKNVDKSLQITKTFPVEIVSIQTIKEIISSFITEGCQKLRKIHRQASVITIFLQTSRFKQDHNSFSKTFTLDEPSNFTPDFLHLKEKALSTLIDGDILVKRAGIHFTMLTSDSASQQNLFTSASDKNPKLMTTLDQINAQFGGKAIGFASEGFSFIKKPNPSPRYTTSWKDILEVII